MADQSPDAALRTLQQRQAGVFTLAQAVECGVSASTIQRRHQAGWYAREAHGVYRDRAVPRSDRTRRFVALLSVGRGAVLSHQTAGLVHGLGSTPPSSKIHLLVSCTCPHVRAGVQVHRTRTLLPHHVTTVAGYPVAKAGRTIGDLAGVSGPVRRRRLLAEAVRRGLTTPDEMHQIMDEMGRFKGKAALRELLDELSPLVVVTRSTLETEFLALTTAAGIPPTAMNHPVIDLQGRQRYIDAVYDPPGLPIELDSKMAHGSLLDWHDDLRRENDLAIEGWLPFRRYNWFDVTRLGHLVVAQIKEILARAA